MWLTKQANIMTSFEVLFSLVSTDFHWMVNFLLMDSFTLFLNAAPFHVKFSNYYAKTLQI